jgi:hypothetical protein
VSVRPTAVSALEVLRRATGEAAFVTSVTGSGLYILVWLAVALPLGLPTQDGNRLFEAGQRALAGADIYSDPSFLYGPLAAILAAPLAAIPPLLGHVVWLAIHAVVVLWLGRRLGGSFRALIFLPFVADAYLGNVNSFLVLATLLAFVDDARHGIPLGLLLALVPKPLIVPIMLWLVIHRRRSALGAIGAAATLTIVGVSLMPNAYAEWFEALAAGGRFAAPSTWNQAISGVAPALALPIAIGSYAILVATLRFAAPRTSLAWAIATGILAAPYAGTVAAAPFALLGLESPMLALGALALVSPPLAAALLVPSMQLPLVGTTRRLPVPAVAAGS